MADEGSTTDGSNMASQPPIETDDIMASGHEPLFEFYCMLCQEEEKHVEAVSFCVNCEEYMCSSCRNYHRKSRLSRHHEILDSETMPRDTPISERVDKTITTTCSKHENELVKFYCKNHEELGCATCFALGHRTCSDIESITEKADNLLSDQEFNEFVSGLDLLGETSENIIKTCDKNVPIAIDCFSDALSSVKSHRERVNTSFDVLENDIIAKADVLKSVDISKLEKLAKNSRSNLEAIRSISSEVKALQESKKACEMYIMMVGTRKKIQELEKSVEEAGSKTAINIFTFEPNNGIFDYLTKSNAFGNISVQQLVHKNLQNPSTTNASLVEDMCIKSKQDKERCLVTGSAILPGNKLVIADYLNEKVKLLDTQSKKIVHELKVYPHPRDVAAISQDRVAVTLEGVKKVLILSVTDKLAIQEEIPTSGECRGVAYANDKLFVTYSRPGRLEIIDMRGNVMVRMGNDIFRCPDYVCVSDDGQTIIVSDYNSCEVISLNMDGKVKSRYSSDALKGPQKLCYDALGQVFVCDYRAMCVHLISPKDGKIGAFLTEKDGLYSGVFSASYCRQAKELYVGMDGNTLKIYTLK